MNNEYSFLKDYLVGNGKLIQKIHGCNIFKVFNYTYNNIKMNIQCHHKDSNKQNCIDGFLRTKEQNLVMALIKQMNTDFNYWNHYQIGNGKKIQIKNGWIFLINQFHLYNNSINTHHLLQNKQKKNFQASGSVEREQRKKEVAKD